MSRQLYNPYASGNQSSSQGQYGLSEKESQRPPSFPGSVSSYSSSGTSSRIPDNSERMIPPLMSQLRNYEPVQSRSTVDEDIASSVDMHISRAREEVRLLGRPTHRPVDQDNRFSSSQIETYHSPDPRMASHSMSSAHQGQRHNLDVQSSNSSLDWMSDYKRPTSDDSKFYSPPASSSSGDSRFNTPNEQHRDMQAIPGLGDYDQPAPSGPSRPKYTSEIAANILLHFGLEKEDLEQLISYPEDQITPANLPFIMREIRLQKDKRSTAVAQSNPFPEPHSSRSVGDSYSLSRFGGEGMQQEKTSSPILQSSKVIDYGHTGKYTGGSGDAMGRQSERDTERTGSMFAIDNTSSRHNREPLQKSATEWKSSAMSSSREPPSSFSSLSSSSSSALSSAPATSSNQTKQSLTQPNQNLQSIFSLLSQPNTRGHKSEASQPFLSKEAESGHQSASLTRPPSALFRGIDPTHPGLAPIGRNEASGLQDLSKTKDKGSVVVEHIIRKQVKQKEQTQQRQIQETQKQQLQPAPREQIQQTQTQQMQMLQIQKQQLQQTPREQKQQGQQMKPTQTQKQQQQMPIHPIQKQQVQQTQKLQQMKPMQTPRQQIQINLAHKQKVQQTPKPQTQTAPQMGQTTWPPAFPSGKPFTPVPLLSLIPGSPHSSVTPPVPSQPVMGLPSYNPLMMMTTTSSVQPSSKFSKTPPEAMINDYAATPPKGFPHACTLCNRTCTDMQDWISHQNTSVHLQNCKQLCIKYPEWAEEIDGKSRQERRSRSKSPSPRRRRGSEGRRDKRRSRSRSLQRSRHRRRSPSWSRSRSRSFSPRYNSRVSSRYRSRSRSHERRSPRRGNRRGSTPKRRDRRGSTPKRRDRRGPSPRRKRERPMSAEDSSPEREKQERESSAERLAKKLLETSGLQSLSGQSDLEAVVKTLAPALVAELAKIKSSSSSSDKGRKRSSSPSAEGKRSSSSTSSSSSAKKESGAKSLKEKPSTQTGSEKASPATMVKLQGIQKSLSHTEVLSAVEQFGKTKSVVLFRAKLQAIVFFEREEDANKLKSAMSLNVNGVQITIVREKDAVSKEPKTPPRKKSDTSSASTSESSSEKISDSSTTPTEGVTSVTEEEVPTLEAKNTPNQQKTLKTGTKAAEVEVKTASSADSKSGSAENPPDTKDVKQTENSKATAQESAVGLDKKPAAATVPKESVKGAAAKDRSEPTKAVAPSNEEKPKKSETESLVVEKAKETIIEPQSKAKAEKAVDADKPTEHGESGAQAEKPVEVRMCTTEAKPEASADEPGKSQPQSSSVQTETSVKASAPAPQITVSLSEPKTREPETWTKAAALSKKIPASPAVITPPTFGEMMENAIDPLSIGFYKAKTYMKQKFKESRRQLLITQLPPYKDVCYTEDDVAALFSEFGFQQTDDNIFVFPQACLAFVLMPTMKSVREVLNVFINDSFTFKGSEVFIDVVNTDQLMTPLGLYKKMMKLMNRQVKDQGETIVFIKNISREEIGMLRDALQFFGSFKNFMPLLNKVFIEFKKVQDAVRFRGWYERFNPGRGNDVHRVHTYQSNTSNSAAEEEIKLANQDPQPGSSAKAATTEAAAAASVSAAGKKEQKRSAVVPCAPDGTPLTLGETIQQHLHKAKISCHPEKTFLSPKFLPESYRLLLITNLPSYDDGGGGYTEADVANLLIPFGFEYHFPNIYVVPQSRMAFVCMPTATDTQKLMKTCRVNPLVLRNCKLCLDVMSFFEMAPFELYKFLMDFMSSTEIYDPTRIIFIRNISSSEIQELRETLKKIGSVRNFLPLLNKVFIEFDSCRDTDRLGVWYSFLRKAPGFLVHRLKVPTSGCKSLPPRLPELALPDSRDAIEGVIAPSADYHVPQGSSSPFWLTMRHSPYVFPTSSPWFIIPGYRTIRDVHAIERIECSKFSTIMLTGLPVGKYKHEDVVRLVWPFFREEDRNLLSLYYRVTVLPLQRRAFVFFPDWETCSYFLREHVAKPLLLNGHEIRFYLVHVEMHYESSEDMLYKNLMKWSNSGAPGPDSLEERLLCVEISQVSVDAICAAVKEAASVAPVVNFLPLANRMCIEMAEPSGVTKVLETQNAGEKMHFRGKALGFETVKSLKQRLQGSNETSVGFQQFNASIVTKLPAFENQTSNPAARYLKNALQPAPPDGAAVPEPMAAEPSSEEGQKPAPELTMDCTLSSDKSVGRISEEEETPTPSVGAASALPVTTESVVPASSSPVPEKDPAELPEINTEILQALTAVVRQHRINLASRSRSMEDESLGESNTSSKTAEEASEKRSQGDPRDDVSSHRNPFDEQALNFEDFVTVDEVGDDADDPEPEPHRSTPSRETKEKQSSGSRRISTRSSRDSKSSSSASRSSKGSVSSSPKRSKDSSDHSRSPNKPSSTSSSKASSSSSSPPVSTETLSSPDKKSQHSRTKSPVKASNAASSRRTRSSSAAQEKEKSTAAVEKPLESLPEQLEETKSAHKVSAEGAAAKSVESETEIETSDEMKRKKEEGENDVEQTEERLDDGDRSKIQPKRSQTETDGSLSGQEVAGQDKVSTAKQLSGEDKSPEVDKSVQGDGGETKPKEEEAGAEMLSRESSESSNLESQIQNEDQPLQDGDNTNDSKDSRSDVTEQPTFEILDSVDDQTAAEDETPGETLAKEEEDSYQIIDSVEEPLTSTETESETDKAKKGGRPSRRSGHTSRTSKDVKEETVFEIVDSVEDTSTQEDGATERSSRRRSTRGKKEDKVTEASKKPDGDEEATFQILDSVEDDEPTIPKSSPRGRKERSNVSVEKTKNEGTPTRRRRTPARETRSREKTPKKEEKESSPTTKGVVGEVSEEVANYEILDSVEAEVVKDDPPAPRGRGKRGRPKKQEEAATSKKTARSAAKKVSEEEEEEEKMFQVVDSVEDESVDDPLPSDPTETAKNTDKQEQNGASPESSTRNEEEEKEPVYQIVDSLEEVQEEPTATEEISQTEGESPGRETETTVMDASKKESVTDETESPLQRVDGLKEGDHNPCVAEGSDTREEEITSPEIKLQEKEYTQSPLVSLEEVSDEEEDYPDDTAEEEELRRRQAAAKEKRLARVQGAERSGESRSHRRGRGGKGRSQEKKDEDVIDAQEMVTLDEVGADDVVEGEAWDGKIKDLVTLDEFVEETERQSTNTSDQKISATSGEGEKTEAEKTSRPAKRKHEDDAEESMNFVTVDEVGEEEEEEKEAATPRKRGRPKKTRHTPVRKSTRGKNVSSQDEKEADEPPPSSSSNKEPKEPSDESKQEVKKSAEVETGSQAAASAEPEKKPLEEEKRKADIKILSKLRRELHGPGAKRSRSQSPSVPADFKLPAFKPNNPLGQEFVVPKTGFFCNLCCVFYHNESTAKELHCSSQKHYDNLKKHYEKLQQKSARDSSQSSTGCVSD